ncbi:DUF3631 domain-containing protein, partial [Streptomyces diastaticus]
PWTDLDGRPLTPRTLARMLGEYVTTDNKPIKPRSIRTATGGVPKGYYATDLTDAWARYCPPPSQESATAATSATPQVNATESVAAPTDVADRSRHIPAPA